MADKQELVIESKTIHPLAVQQDQYMGLIQLAVEKGADINQLEKLMDLQDRYEAKNARKAFFNCLSKFQSEIPAIKKNGSVSYKQTNYTFARIEDIAKAIKPLLSKNGLSYRYEQKSDQQMITIVCIITHEDGHEERTEMSGFPDNTGSKNQIQQIASTVSYLRRYTLTGALGITVSDEDDDACSYEEQVSHVACYPEEDFNKTFPIWKKLILDGKKTRDQIIESANKKGITFSQNQLEIIQKVGNA